MKNLKRTLSYSLCTLLVAFLFTSCESDMIPNAPFKVTEMESCEGCVAQYKYKINSISNPKRHTQITANEFYAVGDTLQFSK